MPVRLRIFEANGRLLDDYEFNLADNPQDLSAAVLGELQAYADLGLAWSVMLDAATPDERNVWNRADTVARFRRAIKQQRVIVFRGQVRLMNEKRAALYEHVIRHFERPPYVIADDPQAALCLDIRIPTGRS